MLKKIRLSGQGGDEYFLCDESISAKMRKFIWYARYTDESKTVVSEALMNWTDQHKTRKVVYAKKMAACFYGLITLSQFWEESVHVGCHDGNKMNLAKENLYLKTTEPMFYVGKKAEAGLGIAPVHKKTDAERGDERLV